MTLMRGGSTWGVGSAFFGGTFKLYLGPPAFIYHSCLTRKQRDNIKENI